MTPDADARLFQQESFVCIAGETALDADSPLEFFEQAVDFMNNQLWGTLAAAITIPEQVRRHHDAELDAALRRLHTARSASTNGPASPTP